ncbi:MAG: biotin--[acetyl-CoA-carboxylase] ligase [Candidatus Cloacimonetes bacterium]|nr:biotin--[acetyl-CoA-carboxylase] ligase [Candidatus Cloacimonadota bacterium]
MKSFLFKEIKYYEKIDSTNLEAKRILNKGCSNNNFVVVAKTQTSGIGRFNRKWVSEKGGLWFSLVFPDTDFNSTITIFSSIILHKTILNYFSEAPVAIKWPNDIFWNDKKLAGILSVKSENATIIGLGVNINQKRLPEDLMNTATSVYIETKITMNLKNTLKTFLYFFEKNITEYINEDIMSFRQYYKNYDYLYGKKISISLSEKNFIGQAAGISKRGELMVIIDNEKKYFISADKIDIIG